MSTGGIPGFGVNPQMLAQALQRYGQPPQPMQQPLMGQAPQTQQPMSLSSPMQASQPQQQSNPLQSMMQQMAQKNIQQKMQANGSLFSSAGQAVAPQYYAATDGGIWG